MKIDTIITLDDGTVGTIKIDENGAMRMTIDQKLPDQMSLEKCVRLALIMADRITRNDKEAVR